MMASDNSHEIQRNCLVALGANLTSSFGSPPETLRKALQLMGERLGLIRRESRFFRTPAFPAGSGPDYVNAAVKVTSNLSPKAVLDTLHGIEEEAGRIRSSRWAARTLDLDLLAMDELVLPDKTIHERWSRLPPDRQALETPDQLVLPHPRLQDRAFVLVPLADVAPEWRHPLLGLTVRDMLDRLPPEALQDVEVLQ